MVTNSTDTLGRLLDNAAMLQGVQESPIVYGIWIESRGWLSNEQSRVFATSQHEVADTARLLWGHDAQVYAFDSSLKDLEGVFITHQLQARQCGKWYRLTEWFKSLWRI